MPGSQKSRQGENGREAYGKGGFEETVVGLPGGTEEAQEAFINKCSECKGKAPGGYTFGFRDVYGDEWIYETNTICEYCGKSK